MSEYGGALRVEGEQEPYTVDEILKRFLDYIGIQKPGLKRFYKWGTQGEVDQYLRDPVARGLAMTQKLMDNGCPRETAASLSLLALYDLVILIDNSLSMGISEGGARVETLSKTLRAASTVYSFAEQAGVTAVRLLNTPNKYSNVTPDKITALMKKVVFEGLTDIGNKLQDKVLVNHVRPDMTKPLLVIIITDGEIEGEPIDQLRNVITDQAVELQNEHGEHGPQAVAYQLAKIGNNKAAEDLVVGLDDDDKLNPYIDCMGNKTRLEDLPRDVWRVLPKLFLGAISSYWDTEAPTNATFRHKDGKLLPQVIDDGDDLEREPNPPSILKGKRNESGGGDKRNGNGFLPHNRNSSSNISPPREQAGSGPLPNGRTSASIQAKNPTGGSPPTDRKANTIVQDKSPSNGSPPTHSQANSSPPTGDHINASPPASSARPIQSGTGSLLPKVANNSGVGLSPYGKISITIPPKNLANASPPTGDVSPMQDSSGPDSDSGISLSSSQSRVRPSPNGRINITPPPKSPKRMSFLLDSQANTCPPTPPKIPERRSFPLYSQTTISPPTGDQVNGSRGWRGKGDTRLKRVIRAFQPGDGVARFI